MLKVASDVSTIELGNHARRRNAIIKDKMFAAENESDLRQYFLTSFDLDLVGNLELYRVDYACTGLWLEVKYRMDIRELPFRCSCIAQMLHYMHKAIADRGEEILPKSFGIVDRKFCMLYNTEDFGKYFLNPDYFSGIKSPSAPHPALESALSRDGNVRARPLHIIANYGEIWDEFNSRGVYEMGQV